MRTFNNRPHRRFSVIRIIGMVIAGVTFALVFAMVFGIAVQYLWNWLMPGLFGLKTITFIQAFALIIICKILFTGIGHHPGPHFSRRMHRHFDEAHCRAHHDGFNMDHRKYFGEFWEAEGRAAFDEYVKRMKQGTGSGDADKS